MDKNWFPLQSIPAAGKTFVLDDQAQWQQPLDEFGLSCRIIEPLQAKIFVLPQKQGVLFRGIICGRVALPCDRCTDDSKVPIKHEFDSFESYPSDSLLASGKTIARATAGRNELEHHDNENNAAVLDHVDEAVIRSAANGRGIEINPAALAWEEFSLALPVKPLCRNDCKGLCPSCGSNKNTEPCSCKKEQGDVRLAALRELTIKKK